MWPLGLPRFFSSFQNAIMSKKTTLQSRLKFYIVQHHSLIILNLAQNKYQGSFKNYVVLEWGRKVKEFFTTACLKKTLQIPLQGEWGSENRKFCITLYLNGPLFMFSLKILDQKMQLNPLNSQMKLS